MFAFERKRGQIFLATAAVVVAVAAALCARQAGAVDDAAGEGDETVAFHRVYAPADRIDEWPRGAVRYVPMDREEFERIVAEIAAEAKSPAQREARVESAAYSARLETDGSLVGRCELTVRHAAARPVLLDLGACDLAIAAATWDDPRGEALLGVAADGRLKLLVERSGAFRFDFTLAAATSNGRSRFYASAPSAMATEWLLDLPADVEPSVIAGLIEPVTADRATAGEPASHESLGGPPRAATNESPTGPAAVAAAEAPNGTAKDRRTWKLELGGAGRLDLSLRSTRPQGQRVAVARQTTDYTIAPRGLSITSTLSLDVYQAPLERMTLRIGAGATLVTARCGDNLARIVEGRREEDGSRLAAVEFAVPLVGAGHTLTIEAIAPLEAGRRWRLPRIAPDNLPWSDAGARIVVEPPLRIERIWPTSAQLAAAAGPTAATVKYLAADAAVDVAVAWSKREVRGATAMRLDLGGEARGSAVLDAVFSDAATTTLAGTIADGWSVESVASTPPEAIADWRIEPAADGRERIIVECRPDAARRAKIVATIRWRESPQQRPLRAADLRVIDWRETCNVTRSLVSIASVPTYQLATKATHRLPRLSTSDESVRAALAGHNGQLQFDLDTAPAALWIAARRAATPYRGEVHVELNCRATSLGETYRVRCTPQGDGLARVVVRIAPAAAEEIVWSVPSADEPFTARRLSDDEARALLIEPGGEIWLLSFDRPPSGPFEIVGERTRKFDGEVHVPLAALHDADAQTGTVAIRAEAAARVGIDNRRLTATPRADPAIGQFDDLRAAYRYVPARDTTAAEPAVILRRLEDAPAAAVAYTCQLTARFLSGGGIHRRAHFLIENLGRSAVTLDVGQATTHYEIRVDGEIVARGRSSDAPASAPLPKERRFVVVTVDDRIDSPPMGWCGKATLQAPKIDVPLLGCEWTVLVSDDVGVLGTEPTDREQNDWARRWFGPLARRRGAPPFDPISWRSWLGGASRWSSEAAARAAALSLIQRIDDSLSAFDAHAAPTWSALLGGANGQSLFIDVAAFDRAGVQPWTVLWGDASAKPTTAAQLLFDADLAIVADGEQFVLTSASSARRLADALDEATAAELPTPAGLRLPLVWLAPRQASASGEAAADVVLSTGELLVRADMWRQAVGAVALPWSGELGAVARHGWRRIDVPDDGGTATVRWVSREWIEVAAWVVLLAAAGFAWAFARRRVVVAVLAAAAAAALLLDDGLLALSPIFSGAWWGLCIGLALAWLPRPALAAARGADGQSAGSWRIKSAVTAGALLAAGLWVVRSWADDAAADQANGRANNRATDRAADRAIDRAAETIHRVFIPVDDHQKPVGDRVYVPEPLFRRLERWKFDRQRGPQGWLIAAAAHRVQLDWTADGASLEARSATVAVDIHTFEDDALVALPMGAPGTTPSNVRLNGALLEAGEYDAGGGRLQIAVAKSGRQRIEFAVSSTPTEQNGRTGVELATLAAATTRLEITAPDNGPEVEVMALADRRTIARGRGMLSAPLAAAGSYRVEWTKARSRVMTEQIESSERLWLDVTPGAVWFEADVVLRDEGGLPEELRVAVDPRLVPLAATVDGAATTWRRAGGAADQLAFRLGAAPTTQKRLRVSFLVGSAKGVGVLRLPRWEPQVHEVARRWLAVNVDEALARELAAGPEAEPMDAADFVLDGAEIPPQYAYRLPRGNVLVTLTTRHKKTNADVDQTLTAVAEAGRVRVVIEGDAAIRGGDVYGWAVRCGPQLKVDRVEVVEDNVDRLAFWTQASDGTLNLFLNRKAGGSQRLRIDGYIEAPPDGVVTIGDVALDGAAPTGHRVLVYRVPSAAVTVREVAGLAERGDATNGDSRRPVTAAPTIATPTTAAATAAAKYTPPADARLLRDLVAVGDVPPTVTLEVKPNDPRIDAASVVMIEQVEANEWAVRAEFRGAVNDGLADDLMLDLPGDWIGDAAVEPVMPTTVLETSAGRRLLVRPVLPIRGRFALAVSGRIRTPANRSAPQWALLDADAARQFVVLPTLWKGRHLGWDLTQMRWTALERDFTFPRRDAARYEAYQIVGERASATLQAEIPTSRALAAYVDVVGSEMADGRRAVLATYDLLPSGVASCRVSMPEGGRLVAAALEDRPATPTADGDRGWRIELESDTLPQRLRVLAIMDKEADAAKQLQRPWTAPRLEDATIHHTTWSVASADADRRASESAATPAAAAGRTAAVDARIEALKQLWLAAANSSSDFKTSVAGRWERRLASASASRRFAGAEAVGIADAFSRQPGNSAASGRWNYVVAPHDDIAAGPADSLVQQFGATHWGRFGDVAVFELPAEQSARFADQLVRDGVASRASVVDAPPKLVEPSEILRQIASEHRQHDYTTDGAAWSYWPPTAGRAHAPLGRWAAALAVVALAALLARPGVRSAVSQWCARHPHFLLAAAGVMWWLWLRPGWFGWMLVIASILMAWRLRWPLPRLATRPGPSNYA